jgi:hypothetical protein
VKRLRRGDELEPRRLRRPILESRLDVLHVLKARQALPRHPQKFGAGIKRQHMQALPQKTAGRLSRAAAKFENRIVMAEIGGIGDVVKDGVRIGRTRGAVKIGSLVECKAILHAR